MVVVFNRYFVVFIMMMGMLDMAYGASEKIIEEKMISLALNNFLEKKGKAENIVNECEKKGKNIVLIPSLFEKLNISSEDLRIALYFLNREARDDCEGDYLAKLFVAGSLYRSTAKHFNREAKEALPYTEDKLYGSSWRYLRIKVDYLLIKKETRLTLEKISALKKPFDIFKTLDILGI